MNHPRGDFYIHVLYQNESSRIDHILDLGVKQIWVLSFAVVLLSCLQNESNNSNWLKVLSGALDA